MTKFATLNLDGSTAWQGYVAKGQTPTESGDNPTGLAEVKISRFGGPGERLVKGVWQHVDDAEVRASIDAAHLANHGSRSIEAAHQAKALEARLILAGVAIGGMVAAEAAALGVPVDELARSIAAHASASEAPELARRMAKAAYRA